MAKFDDLSLVLTSCGRPDLLEQTLVSMEPWLSDIPQKILIDDYGKQCLPIEALSHKYGFSYLDNSSRLGQHASIDRAYRLVNNRYVFHCEDDWHFYKCPDINLAKLLLQKESISCVCFRKIDDRSRSKYPTRRLDIKRYKADRYLGKDYLYLPVNNHQSYGSFTFNPSLIDFNLYQSIGPYGQYASEKQISLAVKKSHRVIAFEQQGSCIHIGWNRHADDPRKLPRGSTLIGKIKRSWYKHVGFETRKIQY